MCSQKVIPLEGEPIQLLKFNKKTKKSELSSQLQKILLSDDIRDCPIAVISIAGALRKGKSFLLSFFLRYLQAEYVHNDSTNWLGGDDSTLSGFKWRGGSEKETTGIWMWSKIFTKILPNGEKIGVMLLDTQGTFDGHTTMKDNVTVFSLSTMLASVQIYNLFHNIQEDDLQHLQLFTEYGKLASEQSSEKAFQSLLFLVRDWYFAYEHPYGLSGGNNLLKKKLEIIEDQDEELAYVRTHLKSCYENINCFLMPPPGKTASGSKDFNGKLKDIDGEFIKQLKHLIPMILAPEKVFAKKMNGASIKGQDLLSYIVSYWKIFNNGEIPTAQTIMGATAEANNLSARNDAVEYYRDVMLKQTEKEKKFQPMNVIVTLHEKTLKAALIVFTKKAVMGDQKLRTKYYNKLNTELQSQLFLYLGQNEGKRTKDLDKAMANISKDLSEQKISNKLQQDMMATLTKQMKDFKESSEKEKKLLLEEIERLKQRITTCGDYRPINPIESLGNAIGDGVNDIGNSLSKVFGW